MPEAIAAILAGTGLAGAAGLNAWVPLLVSALAARAGWIDLAEPYSDLANDPVLIALAAAFVLDFVGDKVAGIDHLLHAAGSVIHPLAGAVVAAAQAGADGPPLVLVLAGAVVAGGVHAGRASVRPAGTAYTAGTANPFLSLAEDLGSLTLTALALVAPVLAALAVVVVIWLLVFGLRRLLRRRRRDAGH